MKHFVFNLTILVAASLLNVTFYDQSLIGSNVDDKLCEPKPFETLNLPAEAGDLIYAEENGRVISSTGRFSPEQSYNPSWRISPNGMYVVGSYIEDVQSDIQLLGVLNRSGERIYSGGPSQATIIGIHWLGNERLLSFVTFRAARTSSLQIIPGFGYFLIDPFERTYTYTQPPRRSPFARNNGEGDWFFVGGYDLTYDGRYLFTHRWAVYDFEQQQPLELQNYEWGIPSPSSHKLLVVEYSSANYLEPVGERTHPVQVYDFDSDTLSQIATITTDQLVDVYSFDNSWSPNEALWAYALDYQYSLDFRPIKILDLSSGESHLTCFGLFFETKVSTVDGSQYAGGVFFADFAWSRDSRYLAVRGVLEGQDMEESLGVYIYDTQTNEIYEVYRGNADIVGWMANSP